MSKVLEGVKFLFPRTNFIISWRDKKIWEITKHGKVDWTDHVINWEPFLNIIRYGSEKREKLVLDFGPDNQTVVFYNATIGRLLCVCAESVIQNISLKEEEKEMSEVMNRELTPEERIEQLEKEKAELELQIKNQAKYETYKASADEIALIMKSLIDAGFSRSESMKLINIAMLGNAIPQFLRR